MKTIAVIGGGITGMTTASAGSFTDHGHLGWALSTITAEMVANVVETTC